MDAHGLAPREKVPASRKLQRDDARAILAGSSRVVISKGRRVDDRRTGGAVDDEVLALFLGATGNLRAPTVRAGKTTLVGFNEAVWSEVLL